MSSPLRSQRHAVEIVEFEEVVNDVEHALPDRALAVDPVHRLAESVQVEVQAVRAAVDRAYYYPRFLEHLHMLRDRGLRHPKAAGRLPDGRRPVGESFHDPAPEWVGQSPERIVSHYANYTTRAL